jgi:hypothetical protein
MTGPDEWRGRVAFILAILAERGSTVLAALLGGLVGALATYLGVLRGKPSSDGDH